jgi:phosphatidylethanolamine-binding protein
MSLEKHAKDLLLSLSEAQLIPASEPLIPQGFIPTTELGVVFGDKPVALGTFFRASECKTAPKIRFPPEVCCSPTHRVALGGGSFL